MNGMATVVRSSLGRRPFSKRHKTNSRPTLGCPDYGKTHKVCCHTLNSSPPPSLPATAPHPEGTPCPNISGRIRIATHLCILFEFTALAGSYYCCCCRIVGAWLVSTSVRLASMPNDARSSSLVAGFCVYFVFSCGFSPEQLVS